MRDIDDRHHTAVQFLFSLVATADRHRGGSVVRGFRSRFRRPTPRRATDVTAGDHDLQRALLPLRPVERQLADDGTSARLRFFGLELSAHAVDDGAELLLEVANASDRPWRVDEPDARLDV